MWLILAFLSATLLGFYDSFKKQSLRDNAVIPVLFLNTLFSSLIFLPFILLSSSTTVLDGSIFHVASGGWEVHKYIVGKSFIVLSSWIFGYFGMKHLPLTIVGPINATRPVMVLVGALLVFGERLNVYQWIGVALAVASFFMLSRSGKKEGIDFKGRSGEDLANSSAVRQAFHLPRFFNLRLPNGRHAVLGLNPNGHSAAFGIKDRILSLSCPRGRASPM